MKLTKMHLRHLIREEFSRILLELEEETYRIAISDPPWPGYPEGDEWSETAVGQDGVEELLRVWWRYFDRQEGGDLTTSDLTVTRESDGKEVANAIYGITWNNGNVSWSPLA